MEKDEILAYDMLEEKQSMTTEDGRVIKDYYNLTADGIVELMLSFNAALIERQTPMKADKKPDPKQLVSGWFRIFGVGLMWKHKDKGLRFSERYGYKKYVRIGNWIIEYLPYN